MTMNKTEQELYDKFPEMISHSIKMEDPNQSILIYSGKFTLVRNDKTLILDGRISYDWIPTNGVRFIGKILENELEILNLLDAKPTTELFIENQFFGICRISGTKIGIEPTVEGFLLKNSVLGDKSVPVSSIRFTIPNLMDFHADPIKLVENNSIQFCRRRIVFKNKDYQITIDGFPYYDKLKEKLSSKGGYLIQYNGEIKKIKGSIHYSDLRDLTVSFSVFLSFINGRRCATLFHQGIYDNEVVWTDYTPSKLDLYKSVFTWSVYDDTSGFNDLWVNFHRLWSKKGDRDFLNSIIHWYLEANKNSGYVEGSIILTQVGLELAYNWYVIENKKLIIGKDADNITAANKMRLLLSQIELESDLPETLTSLKQFIIDNDLTDGIEAFVQIRNALIHSQEDKRKRLHKIDTEVLIEALQLGLWYLELSILKVLNYNGKYQFRCSGNLWKGTNNLKVPWVAD